MVFVAAGLGPNGSVPAGSKAFSFRIDVLTSLPPSSFVLRYAVVTRKHSENCFPFFPSPQSNLNWSALIASLVPAKTSLRMLFLLPNIFPLFCVRRCLLLVLHVKPSHFTGRSTRIVGNLLDYVEIAGFDGAGHAVETMDATSKSLALLSENIP